MIAPPVLASAILRWATPPCFKECLIGDLEQEFYSRQLKVLGGASARAWYWRQVVRSIVPMIATGVSAAHWQVLSLVIFLASAGQIAALDYLWSLLLSQVPLKADVARGGGYLLASLAGTLLLTGAAGLAITPRGLVLAMPLTGVFSLLGCAAMQGIAPAWFVFATVFAAGFGVAAGSYVRCRRRA